jgi:hypothetical protein
VTVRSVVLLAVAGALAGCSTYANRTEAERSAAQLQRELAGKVAGAPVRCLPTYRTRDMVAVDDNVVLFRDGRTTYVNRMKGGCYALGSPGYALVTKSIGGYGLCRGDIAQVVDTTSRMLAGSCSFGDFVPYTRR